MLDFEVVPEHSLLSDSLHFILGQPLQQAVSILQQNDSVVKSVQLLFNDQDPFYSNIILNVINDGIKLIFDGVSQRLKVIEVLTSKVKLRYQGVYFNIPDQVPPTLDQIDRCFGATHPGIYDEEKQTFLLTFRGLSFTFHIPQKAETNYHQGICSLQFPSSAAPVVQKMHIYSGTNIQEVRAPPAPLCCFYGNCYAEAVLVERSFSPNDIVGSSRGITVKGISQSDDESAGFSDRLCKRFEALVSFGDSVQEIQSALGSPGDIYYKSTDRAKFNEPVTNTGEKSQLDSRQRSTELDLHVDSLGDSTESGDSHYFYNYFTYGIDVMFDSRTNRAVKIVLHNNVPGHFDFNQYYRCNFSIPLAANCIVSTGSRWSDVSTKFAASGVHVPRPVVLHRQGTFTISRPPTDGLPSQTVDPSSPSPTLCYSVGDIIFEVMQNDFIATVTICQKSKDIF